MQKMMPDDYLLPEVREGELLDEKKKKFFKVSIDIVEEIKRICDRHHLRYFAAYGTLLGAVRHKGFIPWDDDMDLWMPRSDMVRFKQIAQAELPAHYFLQTTESEPEMVLDFVKIRDNRTTATVKWQLDAGTYTNMGIWVTIFPLDGCPNNDYRAEMLLTRKYIIQYLLAHAYSRKYRGLRYRLLRLVARFAVVIIGVKRLCARRDNLCPPFDGSEKCSSLWSLFGYKRLNCPTAVFGEWIDIPFEYTEIRVPKDYETVLCQLYGDWRKPIRGSSSHECVDIEPDIPWRSFMREKYGWKV